MKINFISIIILSQFFLINNLYSQEIDIQAKEIEFLQDQNLTIAKNAKAIIKKDGIIIEGDKIEYFKDKLFINKNGTILTTSKEFEIESNLIEYKIDESTLILKKE